MRAKPASAAAAASAAAVSVRGLVPRLNKTTAAAMLDEEAHIYHREIARRCVAFETLIKG